jgi:hypothetical protein
MKKFELVIAGGGLTAARTIKSYRESGGSGQIALLSQGSAISPTTDRRCRSATCAGSAASGSERMVVLTLFAACCPPRRSAGSR